MHSDNHKSVEKQGAGSRLCSFVQIFNNPNLPIIAFLCFVVSMLAFCFTYHYQKQYQETQFLTKAASQAAAIEYNIDLNLQELESLAYFFNASEFVERNEFKTYTSRFFDKKNSIQALEWIPRIVESDRQRHVSLARLDGFPGYNIVDIGAGSHAKPVALAREYYPVFYVEPYRGNEKAIGLNLISNNRRRQALEFSRDNNIMVATERITLIQETARQHGMLIFYPIYNSLDLETIEHKREAIYGFVLAVFRIGDMLSSAFEISDSEMHVVLLDVTNTENAELLAYFNPTKKLTEVPRDFSLELWRQKHSLMLEHSITIAGRNWLALLSPSKTHFKTQQGLFPYFVLVICIIISISLISYIAQVIRRSEEANLFAEKMKKNSERLKIGIQKQSVTHNKLMQTNEELELAQTKLELQQAQLIHSEKMASIGQLSAGIAHEINNPVAYIASNLEMMLEDVEPAKQALGLLNQLRTAYADGNEDEIDSLNHKIEQLQHDSQPIDRVNSMGDLLSASIGGTDRIRNIISSLKRFSHLTPSEMKVIDINDDVLDESLKITWNEIKYKAEVVKQYETPLPFYGHANDLAQVIINVLMNAAHACDNNGEIRLTSKSDLSNIIIMVEDNGTGISAENLTKVFDPFFTTKEVGKGTGLGLSISHGIIQKYGGSICIESTLGSGATIKITLPKGDIESSLQLN